MKVVRSSLLLMISTLLTGTILWALPRGAEAPPQRLPMDQLPQVYGLSVASSESMTLQLGTPLGLYRVTPQGMAERVQGLSGNVMALALHPREPGRLLAGGHVGRTGSIGLHRSVNGGRTWTQIAPAAAGKVGFHFLAFSPADPKRIYGIADTVRVSLDRGATWKETGHLPANLIHFAASAHDADTVYAATRTGLQISRDRGAHWSSVRTPPGIASMVHVTPSGQVFAFVVGVGLLVAEEPALAWKTLSNGFEDRVLLRMAVDPDAPARMYAATLTGAIVTSGDGGRNWTGYEGYHRAKPDVITNGRRLFATYCQACHGEAGQGQHTTPGFDPANAPPILAPALDDSAHAWHHSDENLIHTILEGSPREGSPMVAWKGVLSREDAESLVAYIKSLWSFRSIACQGARHMACMRH